MPHDTGVSVGTIWINKTAPLGKGSHKVCWSATDATQSVALVGHANETEANIVGLDGRRVRSATWSMAGGEKRARQWWVGKSKFEKYQGEVQGMCAGKREEAGHQQMVLDMMRKFRPTGQSAALWR